MSNADAPLSLSALTALNPLDGRYRNKLEFSWSAGPAGPSLGFHVAGRWSSWERHPLGAEVVIACTGVHRFTQELDDGEHVIELTAGQALVNPPGVWHTADSGDGGWIVTITPGLDTEHHPR